MLPRLDYIKQARLKLGVTQKKLAILCGISTSMVKMRDHSISQMPVFNGGRLVGILTEDDLAKIMIENNDKDIHLVKIGSVMEPPPPLVDESTPAKALVSLVRFAKCVLVSEKGNVIGIITLTDTLKIVELT